MRRWARKIKMDASKMNIPSLSQVTLVIMIKGHLIQVSETYTGVRNLIVTAKKDNKISCIKWSNLTINRKFKFNTAMTTPSTTNLKDSNVCRKKSTRKTRKNAKKLLT